MSPITLHYIFDPFCGWCYGASPLIEIAASQPNIKLQLHGGGMLTGHNRVKIDDQWRQFLLDTDKQIAGITGQTFGDNYHQMLQQNDVILDSLPPITAIITADKLANKGLAMLNAIQTAHYIDGLRVSDENILLQLAQQIELDKQLFQQTFAINKDEPTNKHIQSSRTLLHQVARAGFPTLIAQYNENLMVINLDKYFTQPQLWQNYLENLSAASLS